MFFKNLSTPPYQCPITIEDQNNWERNYERFSNHFYQEWRDLRWDLHKMLGKQTTTVKNI